MSELKKYYEQILGYTIKGLHINEDDPHDEGWVKFSLCNKNTGNEIEIEVSGDEEGNHPGFLFITQRKEQSHGQENTV